MGFFSNFMDGYRWGKAFTKNKENASTGDAVAQGQLGIQYLQETENMDPIVGYAWLSIAETNGNTDAKAVIEDINAQIAVILVDVDGDFIMTTGQIGRAKALAKEMVEENPGVISGGTVKPSWKIWE